MPQKLLPLTIFGPGFYGLNSQRKGDILPLQWATRAENCVFDDSGRLAARKGHQHVNSSAISGTPDIKSIHEYVDASGSTLTIVAAGNAIYKLGGSSFTDISGTITTPTDDNWKFQNFNGKCVGFQNGHDPIVLTSTTGNFADITVASGSASSDEVLAAFGRLWILDGNSLKYSALLDETHWDTGAGSFDLSSVWLSGMDTGTALAEFNGYLIVFGQNSIAVFENPWVPTGTGATDVSNNMALVENIAGVGCLARDSVQHIGNDILFLSDQGVRSLGRVIQEKSMPLTDISVNVRDDFNAIVQDETASNIKSVYSQSSGFYLVSLPASRITYYFDTNRQLEDGSYRVTTWSKSFTALFEDRSETLYVAATSGYLSKYDGYLDGKASDGTGGDNYTLYYRSGWNDLRQFEGVAPLVKIPKRMTLLVLGGSSSTATLHWSFDFEDTLTSVNYTVPSSGGSEWGIAEWGIGEWSGVLVYSKLTVPMSRTGQVVKFGFDLTVRGSRVAIQSVNVISKIGRMAA